MNQAIRSTQASGAGAAQDKAALQGPALQARGEQLGREGINTFTLGAALDAVFPKSGITVIPERIAGMGKSMAADGTLTPQKLPATPGFTIITQKQHVPQKPILDLLRAAVNTSKKPVTVQIARWGRDGEPLPGVDSTRVRIAAPEWKNTLFGADVQSF